MAWVERMATVTTARLITGVRPFVDATPMLCDPASLGEFATTQGYLFLRDIVSRETIASLRDAVLAECARRQWLDGQAPTRNELLALQAAIQIQPVFARLRHDPGILSVLETLFQATPLAGYGDVCRLAFPNDLERTTAPHQDFFYTRGSTDLWTVWTPLGDCPSELGGLAVLPRSHADGLRPHDGGEGEARFIVLDDDEPWVGGDYRAGDVLMLNALTVHGARPNITGDRIRISVDCRYVPSSHV
jgi:ectoine hydroxylase-related dioxygenase (phytanoyl-CoA dioxygenase family)